MFFFFKQKTAYEMRISDWSSDVCSSDLPPHAPAGVPGWSELASSIASVCWMAVMSPGNALDRVVYLKDRALEESRRVAAYGKARDLVRELGDDEIVRRHGERSEEHTSELQSLMRNSYAVFCLKKKKT